MNRGYKEKISTIAPEDVVEGKEYAFTYSPELQPLRQNGGFKLQAIANYAMDTFSVFAKCRNCAIRAVHEISRKGRLHYHGYIRIYNVVAFYFNDLKKLSESGTLEIDHINDEYIWLRYVYKQHNLMRPWIEDQGVNYQVDTARSRAKESSLNNNPKIHSGTHVYFDTSVDLAPEWV